MRLRIRFAHKVTALIVLLILLSGTGIALLSAFQFRRELLAHEQASVFTVYMAAANYLTAHYKTHRGEFARGTLDYVFSQKFLRIDGADAEDLVRRPSHLRVYDSWGRLAYEYPASAAGHSARLLPDSALPKTYGQRYDPETESFSVSGPVSAKGEVPAYVFLSVPTEVRRKVAALYVKASSVTLAVVLVAVAVSLIATRRMLAPVEALTQAALQVRRGDLTRRVAEPPRDEVGLLARTFNSMVAAMERRVDLMHRMLNWATAMSRELDAPRLHQMLVDICARLSGAASCRLYLFSDESHSLRPAFAQEAAPSAAPSDEHLLQDAWEQGRTVTSMGVQLEDEQDGAALELAIPLEAGTKRRGVVWVGRRTDQQPYEDELRTALQSLVQHAAVAIDNADLHRELGEKQRFEQEMMLARRIQRYMLPHEVPRVAGYAAYGVSLPAYEVGGDYFDYVPVQNGNWHFVIGDVAGKGVAAAMIMTILRSLVHTYVEFEASPGRVLSRVNRSLSPDLDTDMFVTVADIALDPARHTAQIVRAGHEPILVVRGNGEIVRVTPRGTALGLLDVNEFDLGIEESSFRIEKHDTLLLYTDGITEARDADGTEFGYERLERLAGRLAGEPPRQMVEHIVAEVEKFSGAQHQDDITLIVLQRDGS
jgi:serine phosphatase RsbU (regulator of sigma subunit)/HAMP domain-containing protein